MNARLLAALVAVVSMFGSLPLWWWLHQRNHSAPPHAAAPADSTMAVSTETTASHGSSPASPDETRPAASAPTPPEAARPARPAPELITGPDPGRSPIADKLNATDGTIEADLAIVGRLLSNFLIEFGENPVGANREITAQLAGGNARRHAPLPADHPAIAADGQLVDRWGTPFFFHALSGREMELRSAGPDREFYTADDAVLPTTGR